MFRVIISPILSSTRLVFRACGIRRSCKHRSSAPEDGRNYRPKHVELIEITNKLLLLHLLGCLYYYISDARSHKHQSKTLFVNSWRGVYRKLNDESLPVRTRRRLYTGCPRRNVPDFGRVFLMLKYTDITQNTYIQSWTVTEIMAREKWGLLAVPNTATCTADTSRDNASGLERGMQCSLCLRDALRSQPCYVTAGLSHV